MRAACKGMPRNVKQGWRSRDLLWGKTLVKGFLLNGPQHAGKAKLLQLRAEGKG